MKIHTKKTNCNLFKRTIRKEIKWTKFLCKCGTISIEGLMCVDESDTILKIKDMFADTLVTIANFSANFLQVCEIVTYRYVYLYKETHFDKRNQLQLDTFREQCEKILG